MSLALSDLADAVAADFAARGITATVEFGDWTQPRHNAAGRVVIGVASEFEDADLGPANTPGLISLTPGSADDIQSMAAVIYTMAEYATVWCHAKPPADEKSPTYLQDAHKATMALVKATVAAMWRAAPGAFGWGQGRTINPERSELRYGVVATFRAQLLSAIFNDPAQARKATAYSAQVFADMPSGQVLVGEVNKVVP